MMYKVAVASLLACSTLALDKHPIREEIIEEIRAKAKSWTPKALD